MKRETALLLLLSLLMACSVFGQVAQQAQPASNSTQQPSPKQEDEDVVRITTNLVQVDAVVTDSQGRLVTDLKADDFEIREDNRPQKITNFSFVSTGVESVASSSADRSAPLVPPARLRPDQVKRAIALVVDDLGLSFENTYFVRQALKKFVEQQMRPGDLVAIIRTGGGIGALQQFTSDPRQLYAAIERVRWNPQSRGVGSFGQDVDSSMPESFRQSIASADQYREQLFTVGTLGALNYVLRGMRELPGRKSVLLISEGFSIFTPRENISASMNPDNGFPPLGSSGRVLEALRRLVDFANRSSVVIYTMNATGIQTLNIGAADDVSGLSPDQLQDMLANRRSNYFNSQSGLDYLALETGGIPIHNTNDLSGGIRRVLNDQKGYYLIGYHPEESTFAAGNQGYRKFHSISIKVKRPGLRVRSRAGFYGFSEGATRRAPRTREAQMISAITSPFGSNGVTVRLTSLFANDAQAGSFMRSMLHVEARDLTFTDDGDDWHKATFDILAVTFGDNGQVIDQVGRTHTMRVKGDTYSKMLRDGFVYTITVPVKKPGAYQLRVALRDSASERVGSANQFIEVPDIKKNHLTLSGVIVSGANSSHANQTASVQDQAGATSAGSAQALARSVEENRAEADPQSGPAIRRFHQGDLLRYGYAVYNARLDRATQKPQLTTQVRLFRDGHQVFTGRAQPFNANGQQDLKRLLVGGGLILGPELVPGEYVLQVVVTDALSGARTNTATQWIDFEIVR